MTAIFEILLARHWMDGRLVLDASLKAIAESEAGVLVLLSKPETPDDLLSISTLWGAFETDAASAADAYNQIGMGAQILRDLGVGQIRLMGAPPTMLWRALS